MPPGGDPAMAGGDPAMAGGDPAAMGMMAPPPGLDPAMAGMLGGAAPAPAAPGGMSESSSLTLTIGDLIKLIKLFKDESGGGAPAAAPAAPAAPSQTDQKLDQLISLLSGPGPEPGLKAAAASQGSTAALKNAIIAARRGRYPRVGPGYGKGGRRTGPRDTSGPRGREGTCIKEVGKPEDKDKKGKKEASWTWPRVKRAQLVPPPKGVRWVPPPEVVDPIPPELPTSPKAPKVPAKPLMPQMSPDGTNAFNRIGRLHPNNGVNSSTRSDVIKKLPTYYPPKGGWKPPKAVVDPID